MLDCDAGYGNQKKNERKQKRVYLVSMKELAKNNGVEVYSVIEAGVWLFSQNMYRTNDRAALKIDVRSIGAV